MEENYSLTCPSQLAPHSWPLTAGPSQFAPHSLPLTAGTSQLAPHSWPLTVCPSQLVPHSLLSLVSYILQEDLPGGGTCQVEWVLLYQP